MSLSEKIIRRRAIANKCYRKRAAEFRRLGLTSLGNEFKRTPNFKTSAERIDARRSSGLKNWERLVARRRLENLTTRGGRKIYRIHRDDFLVLKSSVTAVIRAVNKVYDELSPAVKSKCLQLSGHLSALLTTCE